MQLKTINKTKKKHKRRKENKAPRDAATHANKNKTNQANDTHNPDITNYKKMNIKRNINRTTETRNKERKQRKYDKNTKQKLTTETQITIYTHIK